MFPARGHRRLRDHGSARGQTGARLGRRQADALETLPYLGGSPHPARPRVSTVGRRSVRSHSVGDLPPRKRKQKAAEVVPDPLRKSGHSSVPSASGCEQSVSVLTPGSASQFETSRQPVRSAYRTAADPHRIAQPVLPPARILAGSLRPGSPAAFRQPVLASAGLDFPRSRTSVGVPFGDLHPPP